MYPFYRELELVKPVRDYFQNQGFVVKEQVPIGFCRADLVAFKADAVTAIELKLQDWKKAIVQAKNYQLGVDFVYLAFPLMKSFRVLRKAESILLREGIGFLVVNEETTKVGMLLEAQRSSRKFGTISPYRGDKQRISRQKFLNKR
jgi:hypothetical protein